jgi:CheY-like chemotaxis protein
MSKRNGVLVIDDDADFRDMMHVILEPLGFVVWDAHHCADGLRILERERERIKMVLLDYFVPGFAPAECAAAIVAMAGPEVEVVMVTAAVDAAARAAELHLSRWLAKPFGLGQLTRLLESSP